MSLHMYFECTRDGLSGRKKNKWISFTLEFSGLSWPQGLSPDKSIADPARILNRPKPEEKLKDRPRLDSEQTHSRPRSPLWVCFGVCVWSVHRTVEILKNTKHVFDLNDLISRQHIF